jgi:dipeptidyl aminopeptidase/acylaminoacyl peptidase
MQTLKNISFINCAVLVVLLTASVAHADEPALLTPEIVVHLEAVTSAAISPDGESVAFIRRVQRDPDDDRGRQYTELFVVPAAGGDPVQYTHRPHNVADIQWSPDNRHIYFRSNRSAIMEGMQVYRIAVDGGEAELITRSETPVQLYRIAPAGDRIAYVAADKKPAAIEEQEEDWIVEAEYFLHRRIFVQDLPDGEPVKIIREDKSVWSMEWSPDGSMLVYQASPLPTVDHSYMFKRIYIADVGESAGGDAGVPTRLLTETESKLGGMAWSPNGAYVAWHGGVDINDPIDGMLFAADAANGETWEVMPGFEGTVTWVDWTDDETLVFISEEKVWTRMSRIPFRGGTRSVMFSSDGDSPDFDNAHFAADRRTFTTNASAYNHPAEVFTGDLQYGTLQRVTTHNPVLEDMRFNEYEYIEYEARDGLVITGLLMKPLDYREGERYPLICQIHGGPEAAYTNSWNTTYNVTTQLYSHNGFMVFLPNYRASTGRGVEFGKANHGDIGGKEFTDVIDGVNHLAELGYIDRNRVGITGGSYGGYFSALAATRYAGEFAASAMFVGISNWFSHTGTSDIPWENSLVHFNQWHFREGERLAYMEASPAWYLERAVQPEYETPIMILHGVDDERVPIDQADELWTGLKMAYKELRGMDIDEIPVTYIKYPRGGHGLFEVKQQLHYSETVLEFFRARLKE